MGTSLPNITLTKGITVDITVQNSQGELIEDLWVNMEPDGEGNWAGANTNEFGTASVGVMSGQYRIWIDTYNTGGQYISGFYDAATGGVTGDWGRASIIPVRVDTNVTVTLSAGLTLTGKVLSGAEEGIGDAGISIRSKGEQTDTDEQFFGGWNDPFAGGFQTWTQTKCDDTSKSWCSDMEGTRNGSSLSVGEFSVTVEPDKEYMIEVHTPDGMGGSFVYTASKSDTVDIASTATIEGGLTREWNDEDQMPVYDGVYVGDSTVDVEVHLKQGAQITGRIYKTSDNSGLDHAWVDFNSDQGGWAGSGTNFDNNGVFTVQVEPGKTYRMNVWPSWEDEQTNGILGGQVQFSSGDLTVGGNATGTITQNWDQASMITVADSETSYTINVGVGSGSSISGTVKTNHQQYCEGQDYTENSPQWGSDGYCGMRDVHVNAWSEDGYGGRGAPTEYDGSGDYRINLSDGSGYIVDVWTPNGMNAFYGGDKGTVFSWDEAQRIKVDGSGFYHKLDGTDSYETTPRAADSLNLRLKKSYAITGRVTESDGTPVRWIWVNAFSKSKDRWMGTSTNNNGFFRMEVPEADDYIVEVWGGDRGFTTSYYSRNGTVTDERRASRLDLTSQDQSNINLVMSSGKTISGVVQFPNGANPGETLWINAWSESSSNGSGAEARLSSQGGDATFEIKGLGSATDYQLDWWHYRYASGFYGDSTDSIDESGYHSPVEWHERAQIDTTSNNVTGLKIKLAAGATLAGTVSGLQGGDKVYINLWSESGSGFGWAEVTGDANTGAADSFSIEGLKAASDYILDIHPDWNNNGDYKGGFYTTSDGGATGSLGSWDNKSRVAVTSGTVQLPELSLSSNAGKMVGSISGLDAGDRAWVDAWSESTGAWAGVEIQGTDATESFTLKGLDVADDYRLNIWVDGKAGGFYAGPNLGLTHFWEDAYQLAIVDNADTTGIVLTIETGVEVQGTITGLDSGRFAWIDMFDEGMMFGNGTGVVGEGTESSVNFTLEGMKRTNSSSDATGYRVMMDPDGYPMQFWNDSTGTANTWDNATLLQLNADSTDQISFTVSEGNSISGTISGFNRNDWIFIDAWSMSTGQMGFANVENTNVTCTGDGVDDDCSATYTIEGVAAASDYIVGADRNGMRVFYSSGGTVPFPDNATPVDASSADQTAINLTFAITSRTLTVTIVGAGSSDTVYVNAWDPQGGFGWDKRTGDGDVTISKLPEGNYYVSAWTDGKSELFYKDGSDTTSRYDLAGKLALSGADAAVSFSWDGVDTYAISGTVLNAAGTAIADQLVSAFSSGSTVYQSVITDSNGAFEFKALAPDNYVVDAWTAVGHLETAVNISNGDATGTILQPATSGIHDLAVSTGSGIKIVGLFDNNDNGNFVSAGVTDSAGDYIFKGLTDNGNYTIKVDVDGDGYSDDAISADHTDSSTTLEIDTTVN